MCKNRGINHETSELEDQGTLNDFLDRLISSVDENDDYQDDFAMLMASLFEEPEPPVDFLAERGLTAEYELTGEYGDKPWRVVVAEIPLDQIKEEDRVHGSQWWALLGYYDGELVRSTEGAPPEPVTAKEAAELFAEYHFDYGI